MMGNSYTTTTYCLKVIELPSNGEVNGAKLVEIRPFKVSPKNFHLYPITPVPLLDRDGNSVTVFANVREISRSGKTNRIRTAVLDSSPKPNARSFRFELVQVQVVHSPVGAGR